MRKEMNNISNGREVYFEYDIGKDISEFAICPMEKEKEKYIGFWTGRTNIDVIIPRRYIINFIIKLIIFSIRNKNWRK